jgi:hypothetical protein
LESFIEKKKEKEIGMVENNSIANLNQMEEEVSIGNICVIYW